MNQARRERVLSAIAVELPATPLHLVEEALSEAVESDVALSQLDKHLAATPTSLTSGDSAAPPVVVRLVQALRDRGEDAAALPRCANCATPKRLPYKVGEGRWCAACYVANNTDECRVCHATKPVAARDHTGAICANCRRMEASETCIGCQRTRPVANRTPEGPLCQTCAPRPLHTCGGCGEQRPAHAIVDNVAYCSRCYQQPEKTCGGCGRVTRITLAAYGDLPDLCGRCYESARPRADKQSVPAPSLRTTVDVVPRTRPAAAEPSTLSRRTRLTPRKKQGPRPEHACTRCGRMRPAQAVWPMGPVCSTCYDAVLRAPQACTRCGKTAALTGILNGDAVCGPCGGDQRVYVCRSCGEPDRAVANGLCPRCHARATLAGLAHDAGPGWESLPGIADLTASPLALTNWLRRSEAAALLRDVAEQHEPPSHELLDGFPQTKAMHYLRSLLTEANLVPARDDHVERLTRWVEDLVAHDPLPRQQTVRRFASWHVIRKARRRVPHRPLTENSQRWARQQVSVARDFLMWLDDHGRDLSACSQADVDLWLVSGSTRRTVVRDFLRWAQRNSLLDRKVKVPARAVNVPVEQIDEDERWALQRTLLHDEHLTDEVRLAGTLVLLYGQHISRVVAMTPERLTAPGDGTAFVTPGRTPLPLPAPLVPVVERMLTATRGKASVGRTASAQKWIFPGGQPGQRVTSEYLRTRLADIGITARATRRAALVQFAQDLPAPVLARALGLHINTAVEWRNGLQADFTDYVAARSRAGSSMQRSRRSRT